MIKFKPISVDDRIRIAQRCIDDVIKKIPDSDRDLVSSDQILGDFTSFIQQGHYMNMRMLKSDVEDAVNFHVLKAKNIL